MGPSETDRVWVQLGDRRLRGDRSSSTGRVVVHDASFTSWVGVDPAAGANPLTRQAAHIEVRKSDLRQSAC